MTQGKDDMNPIQSCEEKQYEKQGFYNSAIKQMRE